MLDKIRRLFGDKKPSNIIVRRASENPFVFGWINGTLTQQSCPKGQIRDLFNMLVEGNGRTLTSSSNPSPRLKMLLGPQLFVKSIRYIFHNFHFLSGKAIRDSLFSQCGLPWHLLAQLSLPHTVWRLQWQPHQPRGHWHRRLCPSDQKPCQQNHRHGGRAVASQSQTGNSRRILG